MPDNSSPNALPATYRLGLAVSLALFLHTLLLSGIPTPMEEQAATHKESVRFELVPRGALKTVANMPENPSPSQDAARIPPFEVDPPRPASPPEPEIITTRQTETPAPSEQANTSTPDSQASQSTTNASAGAESEPSPENPEQKVTRITESPAELDPYVVKLAIHLARELEKLRVPAMRDLTKTVAMEVELQLLGNGALTRARVLRSTGIKDIDEAAYRAALAASPYPQPPRNGGSRNRFEVELLFTPKRL
ncbi:energy transducer TonB [Marinobacter maroccanus]|uniref:Energy transducer TonB n=1 Tax=Marinobacter maroccanus TaxID=2055143 RepID=A0A2S5Z9E0_9GAMM|nr:energy transducer TonB [Marinobacter maroccanus]PPI83996.1 energy transducer TonB [Marinobacter maroccanus]